MSDPTQVTNSDGPQRPPQHIALCLLCMHWWDIEDDSLICPEDFTEDRDHPVFVYQVLPQIVKPSEAILERARELARKHGW